MRRVVVALAAVLAALAAPAALAHAATGQPVRLGFCGGDDWEPDMATHGRWVYVVYTHYPGDPGCDAASGSARTTEIQVSSDGGRTFLPPHPVSSTPGGVPYTEQVDSSVAVGPDGAVHVGFLGYGRSGGHLDVIVATSTDHGATFPVAVKVNGRDCGSCDHEKLVATSAGVYAAYTRGTNHFLALSRDGGRTWTERLVDRSGVVAFAEDAVADGAGNVYVAWADCRAGSCKGVPAADYRVSRTPAGTLATTFTEVATGVQGPACPFKQCGFSFFGVQDDLAIDSAGTLYLVWQQGGTLTRGSPPVVELSRSSDGGITWTPLGRVDDKDHFGCAWMTCYALFPQVTAGWPGQVSVGWMDDRNGSPIDHRNGWNVWLRSSFDGGSIWSGPSRRMSQTRSALPGFGFPYGDYWALRTGACGSPLLAWGEGIDWAGGPSAPGHVEFASAC